MELKLEKWLEEYRSNNREPISSNKIKQIVEDGVSNGTPPNSIINQLISEIGLTKGSAQTYYYKFR